MLPIFSGLMLSAGFLYISGLYLDFSWDGLAYHQRAIYAILKGESFLANDAPTTNIWVNHYTKGTWFYAATIISWFGRPEFGTSYHLILPAAAATYLYRFCRLSSRGRVLSGLLALISFFNPVTLAQWFTYYNDAPLGALGVLLFLSAALMTRERRRIDVFVFTASAILAINIKASGVIPVASAFLYLAVVGLWRTRSVWATVKHLVVPFAIFCVMGIGVLGYSPYVQNLVHHRHIFYPLAGEKAVDIITANAPYGFTRQNRFHNLFLSVFSKSEDLSLTRNQGTPTLKIPGTMEESELKEFLKADPRISGFGPLYSLMLLAAALMFLAVRMNWSVCGPLLFMVGTAIVVNPHSWWARYTPFMWLLPLIPIIGIASIRSRLAALLSSVVVVAAIVNVGAIMWTWFEYYPAVNKMVQNRAAAQRHRILKVYTGPFATEMQMKSLGLKYELVGKNYYESHKEKFFMMATGIEYEME